MNEKTYYVSVKVFEPKLNNYDNKTLYNLLQVIVHNYLVFRYNLNSKTH